MGASLEVSDCGAYEAPDGTSMAVLIPQLEKVIVNEIEVFQDYKQFY